MKKKLFSMLVLVLACVGAYAQVVLPADGNVYRFICVATGKAMTNGGNKAHNTYLSEADVDNTSKGQEWCLVSLSNKEPLYLLYNLDAGQAIDMAWSSGTPGKLLQWEGTCTDNQSFYVSIVDETEGTVQLLYKNDFFCSILFGFINFTSSRIQRQNNDCKYSAHYQIDNKSR